MSEKKQIRKKSLKPKTWYQFAKAPIKIVVHKDLKRSSEFSPYKSMCPTCNNGLLFVTRDIDTQILDEIDKCTFCGQKYQYNDIDTLRKEDTVIRYKNIRVYIFETLYRKTTKVIKVYAITKDKAMAVILRKWPSAKVITTTDTGFYYKDEENEK